MQKRKRQMLPWCAPGRANFKEVDWNQVCFLGVWLTLMSTGSVAVALVSLGCYCYLKHRDKKCLLVWLVPVCDHWALDPRGLLQEKGKTIIQPLKVWCASGGGEVSANGTSLLISSAPFTCSVTAADFSAKNNFLIYFFCNEERMSRKIGGCTPAELGVGGPRGQSFASARGLLWVPWDVHPAPGAAERPSSSGAECAGHANPIPVLRCGVPPDYIPGKAFANSTHLTAYSLNFFFFSRSWFTNKAILSRGVRVLVVPESLIFPFFHFLQ